MFSSSPSSAAHIASHRKGPREIVSIEILSALERRFVFHCDLVASLQRPRPGKNKTWGNNNLLNFIDNHTQTDLFAVHFSLSLSFSLAFFGEWKYFFQFMWNWKSFSYFRRLRERLYWCEALRAMENICSSKLRQRRRREIACRCRHILPPCKTSSRVRSE